MDVAPDPLPRAPHDEKDLRVGLVVADSVDDVRAGLFEAVGPADVRFLVEAGQELHEHGDLLALLRGPREGADDGGVPARAVERLLDGEHVGVVRGLGGEGHDRIEGVVRVVEEHVALIEHGEDALPGRKLRHGKRPQRLVPQIFEGGQVEKEGEGAQVQRGGEEVDVLASHLEALRQGLDEGGLHACLDLEADHPAAAPLPQLVLDRFEKVPSPLVVQLQLRVTGDPEDRRVEDLLPREECSQLGPDHLLEPDVDVPTLAGEPHEPRHARRHLDHGEPRGRLRPGGLEKKRQVEAEVGKHGKGAGGVDGEGRESGEELLSEKPRQPGSSGGIDLGGRRHPQAPLGERGENLAENGGIERLHHRVHALGDEG